MTYSTGDMITWTDGKTYKLNNFIGAAGFNPGNHPDKWSLVTSGNQTQPPAAQTQTPAAKTYPDYDNYMTYNTGDMITWTDGKTYKFNERVGAAGYSPGNHPDKWTVLASGGYRKSRKSRKAKKSKKSRKSKKSKKSKTRR
jgi:hypothetical protein